MPFLPVAVTVLALAAGADPAAPSTTTTTPPVSAAKPAHWKLLVLDVAGADLDKSQAQALTSFIAARAARFPSLDVVSQADLRDLVALDADKRASGCDAENMSCLAEVAGALGAELVLSTHAGKLDGVYLVSMQLFDARVSSGEGRASVQGWSLAELPEKMGPAVDEILAKATGDKPVESAASSAGKPKPAVALNDTMRFGLEVGGGVGAGVGALAVAVGVTPALLYGAKKSELGDLTRAYSGNVEDLKKAAKVHDDAVGDRNLYDNVGRWAVAGGALLVVAGGGALAAALLLPSSPSGGAE